MRAFVALCLPETFGDECAYLARQLEERVRGRVLDPSTHHVTLAFLGDVDEADTRRAMDALDATCQGRDPIRLVCEGLGSFGRGQDRTLYLALARDPWLTRLAQDLRAELDSRGLDFDRKAFVPHVTLARRAQLPRDLGDLAFPAPDMATRVALVRSLLSPEGAHYKELYAVELRG